MSAVEKRGGLRQIETIGRKILNKISDALAGRDRKEELIIMRIITNPASITPADLKLYEEHAVFSVMLSGVRGLHDADIPFLHTKLSVDAEIKRLKSLTPEQFSKEAVSYFTLKAEQLGLISKAQQPRP